jgi:hypothetical protein
MRREQNPMKKSIWALAAAAVGALAIGAAGCGGGGSDEPTKVDVKVTEQGKGQYSVQFPKQIEGGAVQLTLNNAGNQAPHSAQLVELLGGHTFAEAAPILGGNKPQVIPDWIRGYGGIGQVSPGQTGTTTVKLAEGHYVVVDDADNGAKQPAHTEFDVKGTNDADLPSTDAKVTAATTGQKDPQYQWESSGLHAGNNTITFDSKGDKALHLLVAVPVKGNISDDQIKQALESQNGPPPKALDVQNASQTEVLDGGKQEVTSIHLNAGKYAFICFLTDRDEPNKPHFNEGLLKQVTIPQS